MTFRFWWPRACLNLWAIPTDNAVKYFALVTVRGVESDDVKWLRRARQMIYDHWRIKNAGRAAVEYQVSEQTQDTAQRVA